MSGTSTAGALGKGPITDPTARRVCNLAGISQARRQFVTLIELESAITASLRELTVQTQRDQVINRMWAVAKFTKVTCDAFLSLAATLSDVIPGSGKAATYVNAGYGFFSPPAGALATAASGGKPDLIGTATASLGAGADALNGRAASAIKVSAVDTDLLVATLNGDPSAVRKSARDYAYELDQYTLESLDAKDSATFLSIAKSAFDYHEELTSIIDDYYDSDSAGADRLATAKVAAARQARLIQKQMTEMKKFLQSCAS